MLGAPLGIEIDAALLDGSTIHVVVDPEGLPEASTPDRNFFDAILGRDTVQVPPECGLRVIELTEAAWESARTGAPTRVQGA